MVIAIDKDDTLLDFYRPLMEYFNILLGTSYTYEQITDFDLGKVWNYPPEEISEKVFEFYSTDIFKKLRPIDGAVKAVQTLSATNPLYVVTSTPDTYHSETKQNLDLFFHNHIETIYHTAHFAGNGSRLSKPQLCLEIGAEVLIDDHLLNLRECQSVGVHGILFRRPWNSSFSDDYLKSLGITAANSWDDIIKILA